MKKSSMFLFGMICTVASFAQSAPHFGLKAGLNVANIKFSGVNKNNLDPRFGFHIGGLAHIHITPAIGVQPELVYSTEGVKQQVSRGEEVTWKTDYVNLPIMFQYMFDNGFRLEAGPQFGLMVNAKSEDQDGNVDDEAQFFKSGNVGLGFGLGYLTTSGFGINGRYNAGLSNVLEAGNGTGKASNFQASIFYMLDRDHKRKSR
jgi:hypothetical protein